jgi:hypothetical protein
VKTYLYLHLPDGTRREYTDVRTVPDVGEAVRLNDTLDSFQVERRVFGFEMHWRDVMSVDIYLLPAPRATMTPDDASADAST